MCLSVQLFAVICDGNESDVTSEGGAKFEQRNKSMILHSHVSCCVMMLIRQRDETFPRMVLRSLPSALVQAASPDPVPSTGCEACCSVYIYGEQLDRLAHQTHVRIDGIICM